MRTLASTTIISASFSRLSSAEVRLALGLAVVVLSETLSLSFVGMVFASTLVFGTILMAGEFGPRLALAVDGAGYFLSRQFPEVGPLEEIDFSSCST